MKSTSPGIRKASPLYTIAKRALDILLSLLLGLIFLLPMLVACLAILIKDFGNPFYAQARVGKDGKIFYLVKLRSMKKNADSVQDIPDE